MIRDFAAVARYGMLASVLPLWTARCDTQVTRKTVSLRFFSSNLEQRRGDQDCRQKGEDRQRQEVGRKRHPATLEQGPAGRKRRRMETEQRRSGSSLACP